MTTNKKQRLRYGVKLKEKIWGTFRHNELPFSEVFRECDKDAWRHRNTLLPLCRSLTSWWLEHILFRKIEQTEQLEFLRLPNHERNKIEWWKPCPSSLNTSSRFSDSFSFFPLRRFFPPFPNEKWNEERFIPNNQQQNNSFRFKPLFFGIVNLIQSFFFPLLLPRSRRSNKMASIDLNLLSSDTAVTYDEKMYPRCAIVSVSIPSKISEGFVS